MTHISSSTAPTEHRAGAGLRRRMKRRPHLVHDIFAALVFSECLAEAHMETARRLITAIRRGDLECWSSGIPRGMMAAAVTTALASCVLFFAPAPFAQPASDALGELLVGKAAFGDWRTDAPLVRRKITDLPAPYATRSASNPPRVIGTTFLNRPFDTLALLGDILLAFGDVSVGLDQVLAFKF